MKICRNIENDGTGIVWFETSRKNNNFTVLIKCKTILELIKLEKDIISLYHNLDIYTEVLYKYFATNSILEYSEIDWDKVAKKREILNISPCKTMISNRYR